MDYSNWRLATVGELAAIYDPTHDSVATDTSWHYEIKNGIELSSGTLAVAFNCVAESAVPYVIASGVCQVITGVTVTCSVMLVLLAL